MKEKKIKKIVIAIVALMVLGMLGGICLVLKPTEENPDYIETKLATYRKLEDGTLEFSKYKGDELEVDIPEQVKGRTVTRIGGHCLGLYSKRGYQVHIPDTVTVLDIAAFRWCEDLTITGGRNVEEIGGSAFVSCIFREPFPFSDHLRVIDEYAFSNTENMGEVSLNEHLEYIGYKAFGDAEVEQIEIPPNVEYIGSRAFDGTEWLKAQEGYLTVGQDILIKFPDEETVVIPEGVRTVSISGVEDYKKIKNIYIAPSVQTICAPMLDIEDAGDMAELNLYIPASVDTIEKKLVWNGEKQVTLIVEKGSYAEEYAKQAAEEYGYQYRVVDKIEYPE